MSLLTEQEIDEIQNREFNQNDWLWFYTRAIEAKVIEKIKAQGPAGHWNGDCTFPVFLTSVKGTAYCNVPLYRLPEGD